MTVENTLILSALTECLATTKPSNLPIHIYRTAVRSPEERFRENHAVIYRLRPLNNWNSMAYYDQMIGSFQEIVHWGEDTYLEHEYRPIQLHIRAERKLLERLLLRAVADAQPSGVTFEAQTFVIQKPVHKEKELLVLPALKMDMNVTEEDEIITGFEYKHQFAANETLWDVIQQGEAKKGMKVVDIHDGKSYEFQDIEKFSIQQVIPSWGKSIVQYYQERGLSSRLARIPVDTPVVSVINQKQTVLYYSPTMLRPGLSVNYSPLS